MSNPHSAEWILAGGSSIYMDGKKNYGLRRYGEAGQFVWITIPPELARQFIDSLRQMQADAWQSGYDDGLNYMTDPEPGIEEPDNPYDVEGTR